MKNKIFSIILIMLLLVSCSKKYVKDEEESIKNENGKIIEEAVNLKEEKMVYFEDERGDDIEIDVNKGISMSYDSLNLEKEIKYIAKKDSLNINLKSNFGIIAINVLEDGKSIKEIVNFGSEGGNMDIDLDNLKSIVDINALDEEDIEELNLKLNIKDRENNMRVNKNSKDTKDEKSYIIKTKKGKEYKIEIAALEHSGSLEIFEK